MKTKIFLENNFDIHIDTIPPEWQIIKQLRLQYAGKPIGYTDNVIEDPEWDYSLAVKDKCNLIFKNIMPSNQSVFPLELLLRIIGYHISDGFSQSEYAPSTIKLYLREAKACITWLFNQKILVGKENSYLRPASQLTPDDFNLFFKKKCGINTWQNFNNKTGFIKFWHELSFAKKLPKFMSLTCDPFGGQSQYSIWNSYSYLREKDLDDDSGWSPIPLKYAFRMVKESLDIIEDNKKKYLNIYETYIKIRDYIRELERLGQYNENAARMQAVQRQHPGLFKKIPPNFFGCRNICRLRRIENYFLLIQKSAIIIILITTGLRNWELRDIKVGSCKPDSLFSGAYKLEATIKKTAKEKTGKKVFLPVPEITFIAITILEKLRPYNNPENKYLVNTLKDGGSYQNERVGGAFLDKIIKKFCKEKNIGYLPHPHQFRKTIAGWFGLHSKYAILLIMRLFSHESAAMSERYLFNNPLISAARRKLISETSLKLKGQIDEAIDENKMEGPVAERLKNSEKFRGLTGDDLALSLKAFFAGQMEKGNLSLVLTPLCVCVLRHNSAKPLPCSKNGSTVGCVLDREIQAYASTKPSPTKCKGAICEHSLIIPFNLKKLSESMNYYKYVLEDAEYTDHIYIINEAKTFVDTHTSIVEKIS